MNGSLRGLASCKGERTGDPYGAVSCSELMELARRKGKPIPLGAGLRIAKEVLEHLDRVGPASAPPDSARPDLSAEVVLVGPAGDVSIHDAAPKPGSQSVGLPGASESPSGERTVEVSAPYSVGALLYELLTGMRLSVQEDLESLSSATDADLSAIAKPTARLPLEVRLILASALARDPDDRFRGARDFADAIQSFAQHAHVPLGPSELTGWLATLDLWPAHSGMFPRSDLEGQGYGETTTEESGRVGDVRHRRSS
jgi:serine/threonine protein kinase